MRIGVPREIKDNEYRVAITPAGVHELVTGGHEVLIEQGAGAGSAISDEDFAAAGARIAADPAEVWASAELVLKVKEPIAPEYPFLRPELTLFTFLHLAASASLTKALLEARTTSIAYETVRTSDGRLPLLAPMSEVAGRLAPQVGAYHLTRAAGGRGVLLGGVAGAPGADVVIIGGGVAGRNAAAIAVGMRARVTVLDLDMDKLRELDALYRGQIRTGYATSYAVQEAVLSADMVIGAVLVPGARAPKLVSNELVARMKRGAVLVDVAIDQGGCFEDSRPTTHGDPTFPVHGTLFYCVANMPGVVPHTSTHALVHATLPYVRRIADHGWREAVRADPALAHGCSTHDGQLTSATVAAAHQLPYTPVAKITA